MSDTGSEEIRRRLDDLAARLDDLHRMVGELHASWTLPGAGDAEPALPAAPVSPGTRVSWTDPLDASNNAWTGTVEFVGVDGSGRPIAHVDFKGYGRRNLPIDELIIGIST